MPDSVWDYVFLTGFAVYVGIRHVFAGRSKREEKVVNRVDGLEKCLLGIVMLGSLLLPVLYLFTPLVNFASYDLPPYVQWAGTGLMLLALWLFWRSHADLGQNWSISLELREKHDLVQDGVYRAIRHPMYTSIWLWSLCQALLLANWLAGFSALVTFAPLYFIRVPREEQLMIECFGDDYREYMRHTGRLLPRFGSH